MGYKTIPTREIVLGLVVQALLFTVHLVDFSGTCKEPVQADGRTFGGQMIAQSLHCAYETLSPEFSVHSFHCYFLRPGGPAQMLVAF